MTLYIQFRLKCFKEVSIQPFVILKALEGRAVEMYSKRSKDIQLV